MTTAYGEQSATMMRRNVDDPSLEVCWLVNFVGKVRRCCSVLTLVDKESELEINSLPCLTPVQLTDERSDVVLPRIREDEKF